jgi:hypothetical protein
MTGINTVANILYPNKMLDPLKPALILPEVVESSKWKKSNSGFRIPRSATFYCNSYVPLIQL